MSTALVVCAYCDEPVDPNSPSVYRRITGWERKAVASSRRGGSDIVLRESGPYWACDACIRRLQAGVDIKQGSLL